MGDYLPRVVDHELDELLTGVPALAIEGPKGVGKTVTAERRARQVIRLDVPAERALLEADPGRLGRGETPILLDEWQRFPQAWDLVRREVDADPRPGRFILTGSALPAQAPVHSGAGRIVSLRMRPFSIAERGLQAPTVSLAALLAGGRPSVSGSSPVELPAYLGSLLGSGLPALMDSPPRAQRAQLDGYLQRVVEREFPEQGHTLRRPAALRGWLEAYAAATATTTSYNRLLEAATPGESDKPAKTTTMAYREVLGQLWLLDPIPAWVPFGHALQRLGQAPKHHLADPALAARLLGANLDSLLSGGAGLPRAQLRDGQLTGRLFESLVSLSLRVYAQAAEARVHHLRTRNGDHEVDLLVERSDGRVLAVEVKLGRHVDDHDVTHLRWLAQRLGSDLIDAVVLNSGSEAYRRRDGVAVVPAALLGA